MQRPYRAIRTLILVCGIFAGATIAFPQGQAPNMWPDVTQDRRDYQSNIQATDRVWFYEPDNEPGGQHPAIEYPNNPPVTHIVYTQGSNIVVKVRWKNDNTFQLTGTLTWQGARLEMPGPNQGNPGPYYHNFGLPSAQSVTLPGNGESGKRHLRSPRPQAMWPSAVSRSSLTCR